MSIQGRGGNAWMGEKGANGMLMTYILVLKVLYNIRDIVDYFLV